MVKTNKSMYTNVTTTNQLNGRVQLNQNGTEPAQGIMEEEGTPIKITMADVTEANQLSLHCPICAGAVEDNVTDAAVAPVICAECKTLYHRACWEQNGGSCAVLGCDSKSFHPYGDNLGPALTITHSDLPRDTPALRARSRQQELKAREQRRRQPQTSGFWRRLFQRILDAFSD